MHRRTGLTKLQESAYQQMHHIMIYGLKHFSIWYLCFFSILRYLKVSRATSVKVKIHMKALGLKTGGHLRYRNK